MQNEKQYHLILLFALSYSVLRGFPETACMKIFISERLCGKAEYNTSVRADNRFGILTVTAELCKVSSASYCFHSRIKHHHSFTAYSLPILIHRASVCAGIYIPGFLSVTTIIFCPVTAEKSRYFYSKFIFFSIPLFHSYDLLSDKKDTECVRSTVA